MKHTRRKMVFLRLYVVIKQAVTLKGLHSIF